MLIIYPKSGGNVLGVWTGYCNTLSTIYPDNPKMQEIFDELMLEDDREIIANYDQYKVVDGKLVKKQ